MRNKISDFCVDINRGDMVNYGKMKTNYKELYGRTGFILETYYQSDIEEKFLAIRFNHINLQYFEGKFWEYLLKVDGWRLLPKGVLKNDIEAFAHLGRFFYDEQNPNNKKPYNPRRGVRSFLYFLILKTHVKDYLRKPVETEPSSNSLI